MSYGGDDMARNALSSFHPGLLTPRQRAARGRVPYNRRFAAALRRARGASRLTTGELKKLEKSARQTPGARSSRDKQKLEHLFHDVYGPDGLMSNPKKYGKPTHDYCQMCGRKRGLKESPDPSGHMKTLCTDCRVGSAQILKEGGFDAFARKHNGGKMKKNRKRRKKTSRNGKGKMPAGLKRYWAKQRRKKRNRARPRRKNRRRSTPRVRNYRRRATSKKRSTRRRRRVQRNPVRRRTVRVPFPMTPTQTKKYARALARATGKRIKIV